jgi:hypothetical protein
MKVLKARRTAEAKDLKMQRAYVDKETGRVSCCWQAKNREQVADLFKRAKVVFESILAVEEMTEKDLI